MNAADRERYLSGMLHRLRARTKSCCIGRVHVQLAEKAKQAASHKCWMTIEVGAWLRVAQETDWARLDRPDGERTRIFME